VRFIELIIQGIPGTREALRYPFETQLNVWKQKGTIRLTTLLDFLSSLLYPVPSPGNMIGPAKAQQAEIIFESRGTTYRISRDYGRNSIQLSQLESSADERFRELSKDFRFVREVFQRSAKLPSRRTFQCLMTSTLKDGLVKDSF